MKRYNLSENSIVAIKNIIGTFLVRGGGLLVSLFTTPAFIAYFNNDMLLGVWYTILSVLSWFLNFDFGIGNGIRNQLTEAITKNDKNRAKSIISSGLFVNLIVSLVFLVFFGTLIFQIDLNWMYGISSDYISRNILQKATLIVFAGIMTRFFLSTITSIWYSLQKSYVNNLLSLFTSIGQLLFVKIYKPANIEHSLVALSLVYVFMVNIPIVLSAIHMFATRLKDCRPKLEYIKKNQMRSILGTGIMFFCCQVLYVLIMNSNELLVSNLYGAEYTTQYSFYFKLTNVISMFVAMAMTPVWSLVTKAASEKQYAWLTKLYRICLILGLITVVVQFAFIPIEQICMDIWLGDGVIDINLLTAIAFACFGSVFVYQNILSTFCCGFGTLKLQFVFYAVAFVIKTMIVVIGHKWFSSWDLVVWSNVVVLLPYCIVQQIELSRYINKLEKMEEQ